MTAFQIHPIEEIMAWTHRYQQYRAKHPSISLHDLVGKMIGAWYKMDWIRPRPDTTFTIGIDSDEVVREKHGKPFDG